MAYKRPKGYWKQHHIKHREKRLEFASKYYAINRGIINEAKNVPCKLCNKRFPLVCTDFHHRDPTTKLFSIGNRACSVGPKKLIEEILKCDVYCANCHRIIEHGA